MRRSLLVALAIALPAPARAQYFLPDAALPEGRARTFIAPERAFAVGLPAGWNVVVDEADPRTIQFRPADPDVDATLFVRRVRVPRGAHPRQLLLNALEQRLSKLPGFKEAARRDAKISGQPAAAVAGVYYFQGNAQYPRAVEEAFVVRDEEAFVFHFECFEPFAGSLAGAVDRFYKSFAIRPAGKGGEGEPPAAGEGLVDPDHVAY